MNARNHINVFFAAIILIAGFAVTDAQTRKLTRAEHVKLLQTILRQADFNNTNSCCEKSSVNEIYLIDPVLTAADLPRRKYIKFTLISREDVDRKISNKVGIEFYDFSGVGFDRGTYSVSLTRTYRGPRNSSGSSVDYTARKANGKWKLRGTLGSTWVAESH